MLQCVRDVLKSMAFYEKRAKTVEECPFFKTFTKIGRKKSDFYPSANLEDLQTALGFLFCENWYISENLRSWEVLDLIGGIKYLQEGILRRFGRELGPYSKKVVNKHLAHFEYPKRVK